MLFPTISFAVFFAVVFPITWALNSRNTWKKWFLVAASYYFYAFWRIEFTLLLLASSVGNYLVALLLGALPDGRARRLVLWLAVVANLSVLGFFKYWDFFAAQLINLSALFGVVGNVPFVEMALPIAISFLTFHALSYVIDVYDRTLKPTTSLVDILLYISFFPHLIAGPIVRAAKFLSQTTHDSYLADVRVAQSVFLIVGGLFKKVIIANYLSTDFVDGVFRAPADFSSLDLLLGMYAYAIQIYCDFSAYTDIAIGVANLLGYQFPQNFNQPYRALSVQDFWRRWHITLSTWLRDYLYIRLGGNRGGRVRTWVNVMVTMLLGGLWHGASWNFVLWGGLHGAALVVERVFAHVPAKWTPVRRQEHAPNGQSLTGAPRTRLGAALAWVVTFHFVCLTWVFFRSPSNEATLAYFITLFSGASWSSTMTPLVASVLVLGALTQVLPTRWFEALERRYDAGSLAFKVALPFAVIFLISVAAPGGIAPFIYFQF
jgi:D-alanyl-lipoteichoic acid acyltransferase DltB (MBOAT superfamily)